MNTTLEGAVMVPRQKLRELARAVRELDDRAEDSEPKIEVIE